MFRNLVTLALVLTIIYGNNKLNTEECMVFYFLIVCFILGNFGFYFLDKYPNNPFWHFIIWGGYTWHEFPVTMLLMFIFLLYLLFIPR